MSDDGKRIAGHIFADGPNGRACRICGRRWLDILDKREFWRPGESGIAHVGDLNEREVEELEAELERIWRAVTGRPDPEPLPAEAPDLWA